MYQRSLFSRSTTCIIALVMLLLFTGNLMAQFNDIQSFNGTYGTHFAVPPRDVDYWSVDGSCSPAMVYANALRGDNGSACLTTLVPLGIGTRMVKDLNPGSGSSTISEMGTSGIDTVISLWLSADDGSGTAGQELYRVLGPYYTIMSQEMDIYPGATSSTPTNLFHPITGGQGELYFSADDGTNGRELWLSLTTGNPETVRTINTDMLMDINPGGGSSNPDEFAVAASVSDTVVVFAADDGTNGRELWSTVLDIDGKPTSATMLMNINTSVAGASSDPQLMTTLTISDVAGSLDMRAFFTADDGVKGRELWRTDGTLAGTGLVKDIVTGATGSNPTNLTSANIVISATLTPTLFFTVNSDATNGMELWKSRGALSGLDTVMVYDPGAAGSPSNLTAVNGRYLLFFTIGNDLWKVSGTTASLVKSFVSPPTNLVSVGSTETGSLLYFVANDGTGAGAELWKTDGTTTSLVKDIKPGSNSSAPTNLYEVGGGGDFATNILYFSADDGTNGRELWRSDITEGAVMVKDINPGSNSSNPSNFMEFDQMYLFFTADNGTDGVELWQSDGYEDPPYNGMSYKWNLSADIQDRGDPSKLAVVGTDAQVFSVYLLFDFPAMGGALGISEAAHQVNTYLELTDGADRAPLNVTYTDCGDGNLLRPEAPLTDGSSHNAIAFGMIAVLDQDPCDTDSRGPNSPKVPFAYVPAVYDGHDWIPMDLAHFTAGVPTNPGTTTVLSETTTWAYLITGWPANLVAATEDPWQQKRFAYIRIDVWDTYMAVIWGNKQYGKTWVATLPRQYTGSFKALYLGNSACVQPAYQFYLDTLALNGGVFVTEGDPFGACCHTDSGICEDGLTEGECDGTYTAWKTCSDPSVPLCCPTPWADPDNDGDVDQKDLGIWQTCFSGTGQAYLAGCECYDRDNSTGAQGGDGDVDKDDFTWFNNCVTGPTVLLDTQYPPGGCIP